MLIFVLLQNDVYTLLMLDPDAPTREFPSEKYWLHWMITDIKVSQLTLCENHTLDKLFTFDERKKIDSRELNCRLRLMVLIPEWQIIANIISSWCLWKYLPCFLSSLTYGGILEAYINFSGSFLSTLPCRSISKYS